nr:expressed protein [Hymenolepis microstoma]
MLNDDEGSQPTAYRKKLTVNTRMNKHIFYLIGICVTYLLTILSAALNYDSCGKIFSPNCKTSVIEKVRGMIGVDLFLFLVAVIFALLFIIRSYRWALFVEIAVMLVISVLLLASVALIYEKKVYFATLLMVVAMTSAVNLTVALVISLLK